MSVDTKVEVWEQLVAVYFILYTETRNQSLAWYSSQSHKRYKAPIDVKSQKKLFLKSTKPIKG